MDGTLEPLNASLPVSAHPVKLDCKTATALTFREKNHYHPSSRAVAVPHERQISCCMCRARFGFVCTAGSQYYSK